MISICIILTISVDCIPSSPCTRGASDCGTFGVCSPANDNSAVESGTCVCSCQPNLSCIEHEQCGLSGVCGAVTRTFMYSTIDIMIHCSWCLFMRLYSKWCLLKSVRLRRFCKRMPCYLSNIEYTTNKLSYEYHLWHWCVCACLVNATFVGHSCLTGVCLGGGRLQSFDRDIYIAVSCAHDSDCIGIGSGRKTNRK
jgi:hypothetical protein